MDNYKVTKIGKIINIDFIGWNRNEGESEWKFKTIGFNTKGMSKKEIDLQIIEEVEGNKTGMILSKL